MVWKSIGGSCPIGQICEDAMGIPTCMYVWFCCYMYEYIWVKTSIWSTYEIKRFFCMRFIWIRKEPMAAIHQEFFFFFFQFMVGFFLLKRALDMLFFAIDTISLEIHWFCFKGFSNIYYFSFQITSSTHSIWYDLKCCIDLCFYWIFLWLKK